MQPLLDQLAAEERLLRDARECVLRLYSQLRKGDLEAVRVALPADEALANRLAAQAESRQTAVARLASHLDLDLPNATLAALADRLPEPYQAPLRKFRTDLRDLTAQVDQFRTANANLIDKLRSYFRDVLSGLTTENTPTRYGPSGAVLTTGCVSATVASG